MSLEVMIQIFYPSWKRIIDLIVRRLVIKSMNFEWSLSHSAQTSKDLATTWERCGHFWWELAALESISCQTSWFWQAQSWEISDIYRLMERWWNKDHKTVCIKEFDAEILFYVEKQLFWFKQTLHFRKYQKTPLNKNIE